MEDDVGNEEGKIDDGKEGKVGSLKFLLKFGKKLNRAANNGKVMFVRSQLTFKNN